MDKTAYFESLLRRDFLRYVFLRTPSLAAAAVVGRLMESIDSGDRISQLKIDIRDVINLHTERRHDKDAVPAGHLAPWLAPGIVDDITADYSARLDTALSPTACVVSLMKRIERLTWLQGPGDMAECIRIFIDKMTRLAAGFGDMPVAGPSYDCLLGDYESARRITVAERITGSNTGDVTRYTDTLHEYARARCEEILYGRLADMYLRVAEAPALRQILDRYRAMSQIRPIPDPERNPAWDTEYNHLIPVDFYERNIDSIDGAMAFHMVLLQSFARHEDELRAEGVLGDDGELRIFTGETFSPDKWIEQNIGYILD